MHYIIGIGYYTTSKRNFSPCYSACGSTGVRERFRGNMLRRRAHIEIVNGEAAPLYKRRNDKGSGTRYIIIIYTNENEIKYQSIHRLHIKVTGAHLYLSPYQ